MWPIAGRFLGQNLRKKKFTLDKSVRAARLDILSAKFWHISIDMSSTVSPRKENYTKSNPSCCQKTSSHAERLSLRQYRKRIAPVRRTSAPRLRPALRAAPSAGLVNVGEGFDNSQTPHSQTPHSQTPHSRTSLRRSAETCALSNPLDYSRSR